MSYIESTQSVSSYKNPSVTRILVRPASIANNKQNSSLSSLPNNKESNKINAKIVIRPSTPIVAINDIRLQTKKLNLERIESANHLMPTRISNSSAGKAMKRQLLKHERSSSINTEDSWESSESSDSQDSYFLDQTNSSDILREQFNKLFCHKNRKYMIVGTLMVFIAIVTLSIVLALSLSEVETVGMYESKM